MPSDLPTGQGQRSLNRHGAIHVVVLLVSFVLARYELLSRLDSPVFGWRPADGGGIALNYFRHGFRFLYPQVLWGTSGNGYVEMEFPLIPYSTALLFKVFGAHEWVQLVLPMAAGLGLVWLTYCAGRRYFDARIALLAAWLVAVTPVLVMLTDTGIWADPPMVLCAGFGLYALAMGVEEQRLSWLVLGSASISLAVLLKLTALYIGLPVAFVFWKKYGAKLLWTPQVWLVGAGILLPPLAWYWHAHGLYVQYHNTFGITGGGHLKFGGASLYGNPSFYGRTLRRVALYHLTPLFALGFCYGVYRLRARRSAFVLCWLAAIFVYIFVAAGGVNSGHYHYLMPLLPVFPLTAAVGMVDLFDAVAPRLAQKATWLPRAALVASVLVLVLSVAAAQSRFFARDREIDATMWWKKKRAGQKLKALTRDGSLIVVVDAHMNAETPETAMTPPDVFYFADRRGWYLATAWLTVNGVEELHRQGASTLIVSWLKPSDYAARGDAVISYLARSYATIMDDDDGLAFALDRPLAPAGR